MANAKKLKERAELSANDVLAKKYLELDAKIKRLKKELDVIKNTFRHRGSFNTRGYMILVTTKTRVLPMPKDLGVSIYGQGFVDNMETVNATYVNVKKKEAA